MKQDDKSLYLIPKRLNSNGIKGVDIIIVISSGILGVCIGGMTLGLLFGLGSIVGLFMLKRNFPHDMFSGLLYWHSPKFIRNILYRKYVNPENRYYEG